MAKKKKINYTARAAHKRNLEKAAYEKKHAKSIAFWKANGKRVTIAAIAAFVLVIAVILCCKWFVSLDGHINIMFGKLRGVEDNWIVTNLAASGQEYFKLGTFDVPEGYQIDPEGNLNSDKLAQAFYMKPVEESNKVTTAYVTGVKNTDAASMATKLLGYGMYQEGAKVKTTTIDGKELAYIYAIYDTTEQQEGVEVAEEDRTGYSSIIAYVNTAHDSCILVTVSTTATAYAEVPAAEELMPVLETMVTNLTPDAILPVGEIKNPTTEETAPAEEEQTAAN